MKTAASLAVAIGLALTGSAGPAIGDEAPARATALSQAAGLALDGRGSLYVADRGNRVIRRIDLATGSIVTVAGNGTEVVADGVVATASGMIPGGLAVGPGGDLYFTDRLRLRRIDAATGIVTTVAGGVPHTASRGDGGPAHSAFAAPIDVAVDPSGAVYFTDAAIPLDCREGGPCWDGRVRRIDGVSGIVESVLVYDGLPTDLAADRLGNVYLVVATRHDCCTPAYVYRGALGRSWSQQTGGMCPLCFSMGSGPVPALTWFTQLDDLSGVAVDAAGRWYVGHGVGPAGPVTVVRAEAGQVVHRIAGDPEHAGCDGDGGPASAARFHRIRAMVADDAGNLYVSDGDRVRRIDAVTGMIDTVAGLAC